MQTNIAPIQVMDYTQEQPKSALPEVSPYPLIITEKTTISQLQTFRYYVENQTVVQQVEKTLRASPDLPGVIVTNSGKIVGIISRRRFFELLGTRYGVAVFLNRPVHIMLKHVGETLTISGTCTIQEAVHLALERDNTHVYEPILINSHMNGFQLLDVYTLLLAQSQLFATLQKELQAINTNLENRVIRRTQQLTIANTQLTKAKDTAIKANQFKTELMAKVNHELRTPLGAIMGYVQLLQLGSYGPILDEQKEPLTLIISASNYLNTLVSSLLDQARLEKGKLELETLPFLIAEFVAEVDSRTRILAERTGLEFKVMIEPEFPEEIIGDKIRIQQIWANLLSNAIKFTEVGYINTHIRRNGEKQWVIEVSDTGKGIPKEAQAHIFDAFVQVDGSPTRQRSGAGLGLSISASIVALMGGQIHLQSEVDKGTTFVVYLPLQVTHKNLGDSNP